MTRHDLFRRLLSPLSLGLVLTLVGCPPPQHRSSSSGGGDADEDGDVGLDPDLDGIGEAGDTVPCDGDTVDVWRFTGDGAVDILVDTVSYSTTFDPVAWVSDDPSGNGDVLAFGDDEDPCSYPPEQYGCPELEVEEVGTLYLFVGAFPGNCNSGGSGEYVIDSSASFTLVEDDLGLDDDDDDDDDGGSSCEITDCEVDGFQYTCSTGNHQINYNYGGSGPNNLSSYVVSFTNGHWVRCSFYSSWSGSCADDTGSSCSF